MAHQRASTPDASLLNPLLTQQQISRRTLLGTLAGLALVGGSVAQLTTSCGAASPHPSPTVGTVLYTYHGHSVSVLAVAWSPNSKRIASASLDGNVHVWNATNGGQVYIYRDNAIRVAWSPDSKRIASGGADVQVWNATNGGQVYTYHGHSGPVFEVAWSPGGTRLASASADKTVQVWDAANGEHVYIYRGHSDPVTTVAWSSDGTRIASGGGGNFETGTGGDTTVQVWDAATGGQVYTYHGHSRHVSAVAWSPDSKRIASSSYDKTVQVWDAATGGQVYTYHGHSEAVYAVAWSPDGTRIASASADKTVQVWDAATGGQVYTYHGHSDGATSVTWSPDGTRIASGGGGNPATGVGGDTTVQVWQAV